MLQLAAHSARPLRTRSCIAVGFLAMLAGRACAFGIVDFESDPGTNYDLYYGATRVDTISHSATHSISLPMSVESDTPLVRLLPSYSPLSNVNGYFWANVPSAQPDLLPYMYYGVDTNGDHIWNASGDLSDDSLIIAFNEGAIPPSWNHDEWVMSGLDGLTKVHVVGARPGLAAGTYSSSGTQDTLNNLRAMTSAGSTLWGDLGLMRIYVAAGEWPGVGSYNAYIDDISIVPEPATIVVLGLGALAMLRRRAVRK